MKRLALFVGINTYPDSPLSCARADAEVLFREFKSRYDATSILTDREASPERIVHEIEKFQHVLSPGDMFLFYFSGHGCEQGGDRVLAVPHYDVKGNYMEMAGLTIDILKGMTDVIGVHRLFILDCCRSAIQSVDNVTARGKMAGYMARHGSKTLIQPTILSSSAPGQSSYEHTASGHGYFTEAFLAAIRNSEVRTFNMFRDRLDYEMQSLRTPGAQDPYFEGGIGSNLPFWPTWDKGNEHAASNQNRASVREVKLGDVVDAFNGLSHSCFYVGGAVPEKKRRNAWNSMRVKGYDSTILALFDNTFWGGSSDGFVLTGEGLYARNSSGDAPIFVAWSDMRRVYCHEKYLIVNDNQIDTLYFDDDSRLKCCQALAKLVSKVTGSSISEHATSNTPSINNTDVASNGNVSQSCARFRMVVEDKFEIKGRGIVVTGIVKGKNVRVGCKVNILRWEKYFCDATIIGIEIKGKLVVEGTVGENVGLLLRFSRRVSISDIEADVVLRECTKHGQNISTESAQSPWHEGMTHPTVPHIIAMPQEGKWRCEAGYVLINPRNPLTGAVWKPRHPHPQHPHVVAADKEGSWTPDWGYWWINQEDKSDYRVVWISGARPIEHVYSSDIEGRWCCDPGYKFKNPASPLDGVLRIDHPPSAHKNGRKMPCRKKKSDYPHVVIRSNDGALSPEPGYSWKNSAQANDYDVVWKPGYLHPDIPHIVASDVQDLWIPENGYEWDGPRSVKEK